MPSLADFRTQSRMARGRDRLKEYTNGRLRLETRSRSTDWSRIGQRPNSIMKGPGNTVAGYQVYGALIDDVTLGKNYVDRYHRDRGDGSGHRRKYLHLFEYPDQNRATGFGPFGSTVGVEYYVQFSPDPNGAASALPVLTSHQPA